MIVKPWRLAILHFSDLTLPPKAWGKKARLPSLLSWQKTQQVQILEAFWKENVRGHTSSLGKTSTRNRRWKEASREATLPSFHEWAVVECSGNGLITEWALAPPVTTAKSQDFSFVSYPCFCLHSCFPGLSLQNNTCAHEINFRFFSLELKLRQHFLIEPRSFYIPSVHLVP
jgi:hypothetical protein